MCTRSTFEAGRLSVCKERERLKLVGVVWLMAAGIEGHDQIGSNAVAALSICEDTELTVARCA